MMKLGDGKCLPAPGVRNTWRLGRPQRPGFWPEAGLYPEAGGVKLRSKQKWACIPVQAPALACLLYGFGMRA